MLATRSNGTLTIRQGVARNLLALTLVRTAEMAKTMRVESVIRCNRDDITSMCFKT